MFLDYSHLGPERNFIFHAFFLVFYGNYFFSLSIYIFFFFSSLPLVSSLFGFSHSSFSSFFSFLLYFFAFLPVPSFLSCLYSCLLLILYFSLVLPSTSLSPGLFHYSILPSTFPLCFSFYFAPFFMPLFPCFVSFTSMSFLPFTFPPFPLFSFSVFHAFHLSLFVFLFLFTFLPFSSSSRTDHFQFHCFIVLPPTSRYPHDCFPLPPLPSHTPRLLSSQRVFPCGRPLGSFDN